MTLLLIGIETLAITLTQTPAVLNSYNLQFFVPLSARILTRARPWTWLGSPSGCLF
jgi:hypothetical protein